MFHVCSCKGFSFDCLLASLYIQVLYYQTSNRRAEDSSLDNRSKIPTTGISTLNTPHVDSHNTQHIILRMWTQVALVALLGTVHALTGATNPRKVLVTGAAGRTGQLVFEALQKDPLFDPIALVRSESSGRKLCKATKGVELDHIVVLDVTKLSDDKMGLEGIDSMVICTSAVPRISKRSLLKQILKIPFNLLTGKKAIDFRSMKFVWKHGGYPEKVDYQGQKAQIDLAERLGVSQVVIVSSMGGTDKDNFLNSVGKSVDGSGNGDILLWKRKAEKYLVDSGINYTIIHPGGLVDKPAGTESFVLDVDDNLLENKKRSISRADVANLCVAALKVCRRKKVSLDCITREPAEGTNVVTAEEALTEFLSQEKVYDYSL